MRARVVLLGAVFVALALPVAASAHPANVNTFAFGMGSAATALSHGGPVDDGGANFEFSRNMDLIGFSERLPRPTPGSLAQINSDLAFWGDRAYEGTWSGFRILDIDDPDDPRELIDYRDCAHPNGQGDVVVWGSILVRTWDGNTSATQNLTCDGQPVPGGTSGGPPGTGGFEGLHVFDVSDPGNPELKASIDLTCGSHTATGVPDLRNRRLLVYSTPSSGSCEGIDVVEVPLSRPQESEFLRFEAADPLHPPGSPAPNTSIACHDTAVILGEAKKAACAGGAGFAVWSLGGADGGSVDNPRFLYNHAVGHGVGIGHSAAFSWDGETIVFGHEPGGGTQPRCTATGTQLTPTTVQTDDMKSFFFFDTESGEELGQWTLTRDQTIEENCTLHNYNIVPTKSDDILVHGSYQSGIGVLDFSDPENAREIAFADPAPVTPRMTAGDWGSYFYNGKIYEADIQRGLFVWDIDDRDTDRAERLRHLNPQTQEFTIGARKDHDRWNEGDRWHDDDDRDRD
jgi:hypothetical protein